MVLASRQLLRLSRPWSWNVRSVMYSRIYVIASLKIVDRDGGGIKLDIWLCFFNGVFCWWMVVGWMDLHCAISENVVFRLVGRHFFRENSRGRLWTRQSVYQRTAVR